MKEGSDSFIYAALDTRLYVSFYTREYLKNTIYFKHAILNIAKKVTAGKVVRRKYYFYTVNKSIFGISLQQNVYNSSYKL